jgi:YVTN family beta-propeller protein
LTTLDTTPDITAPGIALAMARDDDNTKIYVVNDDDTVQVIDVASRAVESTISLSTYFGATLDYGAVSITYTSETDTTGTHEYLLIGSSTLGGTLTIEL